MLALRPISGYGLNVTNDLAEPMASEPKEDLRTDRSRPRLRPFQRKDGTWCVEALWPYAPASHIGSFKTESEVEGWISLNSSEYFRKCSRHSTE